MYSTDAWINRVIISRMEIINMHTRFTDMKKNYENEEIRANGSSVERMNWLKS